MGGKIYLNSDISLTYFCRNTLSGIIKQSYENGKWNIITSKLCPGTMSLRHFIPLIFTLSLLGLPILGLAHQIFNIMLLLELGLYFVISMLITFKVSEGIKESLVLIMLFPFFHISYGVGSLMGFFKSNII